MMAPLGIKGNQRELHKLGSHALKQFLYKSGAIGAFIKARCTCQHGAWAAFFFKETPIFQGASFQTHWLIFQETPVFQGASSQI